MGEINLDKLAEQAEFSFGCEPEQIPYVGNCSAVSPDVDREQEAWVRDQLARGNDWAWCTLFVHATLPDCIDGVVGVTYTEYVGCCSFDSEDDAYGAEFADMKYEALEGLARELGTRLGQARLAEMGLLDGPPRRYLVARFDVTELNESQIANLEIHVAAQAEASEDEPEHADRLDNYPDVNVTFTLE